MEKNQICLSHSVSSLSSLSGQVRSPQFATARIACKPITRVCTARLQDVRSTEEDCTLVTEKLPSVDDCAISLWSCQDSNQLTRIKKIHVHLCNHGLQDHPDLCNHVVTAFVNCGSRPMALNAFNRLHERRNELSWTALIKDYVDYMEFQQGLLVYDQMLGDSVAISKYTLVAAIQACRGQQCLVKGREVHCQATKFGFCSTDVYLRSSLVDLYSKCGSMEDAQGIIDQQPEPDVVSTTALMTGYVKQGENEAALKCYDQMQSDGVTPSGGTFVCSLKAIIPLGDVEKGLQIHTDIIQDGWETNTFIGTSLVDLYAKCGMLMEAQSVFDELPDRDVVSWTALIAGYVEHGFGEEALNSLEKMDSDGVPQNGVTLMFGLKACSIIGNIGKTQAMHSSITKAGSEYDLLVANSLVDIYSKWGLLADAWLVFDKLEVKDVATWNTLMSGYCEQGLGEEALRCFHVLRAQGTFPDVVSFVNCLGACGSVLSIDSGRELHIEVVKQGIENVLCIGSAVVDMYMKCQYQEDAWEVFHHLPSKDCVAWTALMEGYAEMELYEEALDCMEQMQQEQIPFQSHSYASGLKACKGMGLVVDGQEIHAGLIKKGFDKDIVACNSLVDFYATTGLFLEAEAMFGMLQSRDGISWIVLMAGYGESGLDTDVLHCFETMQQEGGPLNAGVFVMVLKACGNLGDIDKGQEVHTVIICERLERDTFVHGSLVDMYFKCGRPGEAFEVFREQPGQDVATWTALISGLVDNGFGQEAFTYWEQMELCGVLPNAVTFVCGLKACGREDLYRAQRLYKDLIIEGFEANMFVGTSLIDFYAKCGLLDEAKEIFDEMPYKDVVAWTALLAGLNGNRLEKEALACFKQQKTHILPNAVTILSALKSCGSLEVVNNGWELHSEVILKGFETNEFIVVSLVDMYARCGSLKEAEKVCEDADVKEWLCWTVLMAGYAKRSQTKNALDVLDRMQLDGFFLSAEGWANVVSSCDTVVTRDLCLEFHKVAVQRGYDGDASVQALLDSSYCTCGLSTGMSGELVTVAPHNPSVEAPLLAV